jgi:guanyl-specific ribonuclease Sa
MTRWWRFRTHLASGLVVLASLLPITTCGPQPPAPPAPAAQVQVAPQEVLPAHVRETLGYIRQHGYAPPGYVGGRVFGNYEGLLPRYNVRRKRIEYREWDVHPRAEGRTRGTERLVTGNDGRAWYTRDHYRSFVEVK